MENGIWDKDQYSRKTSNLLSVLYMDDLKIYSSNKSDLYEQIKNTEKPYTTSINEQVTVLKESEYYRSSNEVTQILIKGHF